MINKENESLIVLIFGASGSGKSTLVMELKNISDRVSINQKATTRPLRKYDSDEIISVKNIDKNKYPFIYCQYGNEYGINQSEIDDAIQSGKDHFIICNDIDIIKTLFKKYGNRVKTLFILFNAPKEHIVAVQKSRGIDDDNIRLRLEKIDILSQIFIRNNELFDGVVLNKLDAPIGDMVFQVERILKRNYSNKEYEISFIDKSNMSEMLEILNIINDNLKNISGYPSKIVHQGFVLILSGILNNEPSSNVTNISIKKACQKCGLKGSLINELGISEQINEKILGSIRMAQFIIVDLTHRSPNIFYEIGYAHALKKPTVLIAREGTKQHLNIQGYPVIFFNSSARLEKELMAFFEKHK
ncbi:MAG: hypothetical protein SCALA702_01070 [Melioribacteraceae bacterium]|nr:MAG: hypothetical protein SCALA702_01070 [Melioribacteraceae bacterium]